MDALHAELAVTQNHMIQAGSMPRPVSTPLPMEDLQTLSDEIQSALSFASKLCFDEDENSPGKPLDREDMQVLYAKMLAVSSNWQQLVQKSEATKLFPITGVSSRISAD